DSELGRHQRAKRQQYLALFGLKGDGPDQTFWDVCDQAERKLADGLAALGPHAAAQQLFTLFTTPWPAGLNQTGARFHPEQGDPESPLLTHAALIAKRRYYRWQRSAGDLKYPDAPEVFDF